MISKIGCKRIWIFTVIAYIPSIMVAVVIFLNGGMIDKDPLTMTPLAGGLLTLLMIVPALANILTRGITGEGKKNVTAQAGETRRA